MYIRVKIDMIRREDITPLATVLQSVLGRHTIKDYERYLESNSTFDSPYDHQWDFEESKKRPLFDKLVETFPEREIEITTTNGTRIHFYDPSLHNKAIHDFEKEIKDFETLDADGKQDFVNFMQKEFKKFSEKTSILPKSGDYVICFRDTSGTDSSDFKNKVRTYDQIVSDHVKRHGSSSCVDFRMGEVSGMSGDKVSMRCGYSYYVYKIIDKNTLQEKPVDTSTIKVEFDKIVKLCHDSNCNLFDSIFDEMSGEMNA